MENYKRPETDDGTLAFLQIEPAGGAKRFNCRETTQQQLINRTFWLCDYIKGVHTKHGDDRYIVLIKDDPNAPMSEARKFFTNSVDIKHVLDRIKELGAWPRKVTMQANGSHYYLE